MNNFLNKLLDASSLLESNSITITLWLPSDFTLTKHTPGIPCNHLDNVKSKSSVDIIILMYIETPGVFIALNFMVEPKRLKLQRIQSLMSKIIHTLF